MPTVKPDKLREQIGALPEAAKAAVGELFTAKGWPRLTEPWEPDALYDAAVEIEETARRAGFVNWQWGPMWDLTDLSEMIATLPDDMRDLAAGNAHDAGVPYTGRPDLWTPEHCNTAVMCIESAAAQAALRHRRLMAALGDATDDQRHEWVKVVTNGRTESSKGMTGPEISHLAGWAESRGILGDGAGELTAFAPDWRAEGKRLGVKIPEFVERAKEFCKARQLPAPVGTTAKALDQYGQEPWGYRVWAALLGSVTDGATMTENTAAEVAQMAPAEPIVAEPCPEIPKAVEDIKDAGAMMAEVATMRVLDALRADHTALERKLDAILTMIKANGEAAAAALEFIASIREPLGTVLPDGN